MYRLRGRGSGCKGKDGSVGRVTLCSLCRERHPIEWALDSTGGHPLDHLLHRCPPHPQGFLPPIINTPGVVHSTAVPDTIVDTQIPALSRSVMAPNRPLRPSWHLSALLLASLPSVAPFSFSYSAPTQCGQLSVAWTGGTGPYQLLITPVCR